MRSRIPARRSSGNQLLALVAVAWAVSLIVICVRIGLHPRSHSVFGYYWDAGYAWLHGNPLYPYGGPRFVYSPLFAAFFALFALLPVGPAEIVWRVFLGLFVVGAVYFASRKVWRLSRPQVALVLLLVLPLTLNNLNNGQANLVLEGLFLLAAACAMQSRWLLCALLSAIAAYCKIYPVAVGLLFFLIFPRELWWRLFFCLILLFCLSLILQAPSYAFSEYDHWLKHLAADKRREANYYGYWRDFYLLLRIAGIPITAKWWVVLQLAAGGLAGVVVLLTRRAAREHALFLALSLGIVWMLLFGPATEASTYVLISVPATYLCLISWSSDFGRTQRVIASIVFGGLLVADFINSVLRPVTNVHLIHAIQPVLTLGFCLALAIWWRRVSRVSAAPAGGNAGVEAPAA